MMYYVGERRIKATFFVDNTKKEIRTMEQTFKTCAKTIDECRENLTKKVNEYASLPLMIEVTPISEYFEK